MKHTAREVVQQSCTKMHNCASREQAARFIIVGSIVIALLLNCCCREALLARKRHDAARYIATAGGSITYEYKGRGGVDFQSRLAEFLDGTLGLDWGDRRYTVVIKGRRLEDREWQAILCFDDIIDLQISDSSFSDADLENVSRLPKLSHIDVSGATVSYSGLRKLLQSDGKLNHIVARRTSLTSLEMRKLVAEFPTRISFGDK